MSDEVMTLCAVIRAREGHEARVEAALGQVARSVAAHEPQTLAYHVSRAVDDASVFVTFERFASASAMAAHNASAAVAEFSAAVADSLAAPVEVKVYREVAAAPSRSARLDH